MEKIIFTFNGQNRYSKVMKIGLYARVSTTDKGQDTELQLRDLRRYAEARGWTVHSEYIDHCSGSKDRRPELARLLDDSRKRNIDGILVWRLDRFGRSLKHLINTLDELRSLGVSFISFSENLDFGTSTGQLLFHLLGAFAEFERNLIRERVKAGIANARAKGKKHGRKPVAPVDRSKIISLYIASPELSVRQIAKQAQQKPGTVHKTLLLFKTGKLDIEGFECNNSWCS